MAAAQSACKDTAFATLLLRERISVSLVVSDIFYVSDMVFNKMWLPPLGTQSCYRPSLFFNLLAPRSGRGICGNLQVWRMKIRIFRAKHIPMPNTGLVRFRYPHFLPCTDKGSSRAIHFVVLATF